MLGVASKRRRFGSGVERELQEQANSQNTALAGRLPFTNSWLNTARQSSFTATIICLLSKTLMVLFINLSPNQDIRATVTRERPPSTGILAAKRKVAQDIFEFGSAVMACEPITFGRSYRKANLQTTRTATLASRMSRTLAPASHRNKKSQTHLECYVIRVSPVRSGVIVA